MARELTDTDGVAWTCVQAFAGLGEGSDKTEAARVDGTARFLGVCTPSGGARSVRLALEAGWDAALTDDQLLDAIRAKLDQAP